MIRVHISEDRLSASIEVEAPVSQAQLRAELERAGVCHGLLEDRLQGALELAERVGSLPRPVVIARGEAAICGRPAELELALELGGQHGSVDAQSLAMDFREQSAVCNVTEGSPLGTWRPAEVGVAGCGVDGCALAAAKHTGRDARFGAGVLATPAKSADGAMELRAAFDGVVRVDAKGELSVSELYCVAGDVNLEVGNIDVHGSVQVSGNVQAGFRVTARHDIRVAGSIEDATIEVGGALEVSGGIFGGGEGYVKAGEGLRATFAQNASLECGGDVVLGSDTRSTVRCSGELVLEGGAGHLRGGDYWAGRGLRARELGSAQGAPTAVRVGTDPLLAREHALITKDLRELGGKSRKLQRERSVESSRRLGSQLTREQSYGVRRLMKARRELDRAVRILTERQAALEAEFESAEEPTIRVDNKIHSGVELRIGDAQLLIEKSRSGGVFRHDTEFGGITSD